MTRLELKLGAQGKILFLACSSCHACGRLCIFKVCQTSGSLCIVMQCVSPPPAQSPLTRKRCGGIINQDLRGRRRKGEAKDHAAIALTSPLPFKEKRYPFKAAGAHFSSLICDKDFRWGGGDHSKLCDTPMPKQTFFFYLQATLFFVLPCSNLLHTAFWMLLATTTYQVRPSN